ncbi:MAG: transposase family protein [Nitrososphaeraceae archaeon]
MKKSNQIVQMDILGPFYLENCAQKNYFISCEDDCSRKVSSEWSERKRSLEDVLQVLEDYIVENGKPYKILHDNGKQFTSKIKYSDIFYNVITLKINPFLHGIHNYKVKLWYITR